MLILGYNGPIHEGVSLNLSCVVELSHVNTTWLFTSDDENPREIQVGSVYIKDNVHLSGS